MNTGISRDPGFALNFSLFPGTTKGPEIGNPSNNARMLPCSQWGLVAKSLGSAVQTKRI